MSTAPWRVLFADDDPTASLLVQVALGGSDFVLTQVDNGSDALTEFQNAAFDIALLDVEMPGLNGFEVCSAIRRTHGDGFPVVLVTGRRDDAFVERARQLSVTQLAKPVDWMSLPAFLHSLLGARPR